MQNPPNTPHLTPTRSDKHWDAPTAELQPHRFLDGLGGMQVLKKTAALGKEVEGRLILSQLPDCLNCRRNLRKLCFGNSSAAKVAFEVDFAEISFRTSLA